MRTSGERKDEFAENLRLSQTHLFGFIYALVRNFDDADDLFQKTSLVLWRKYDQYDDARSFVAWACGIARYEVANFLRDRGRDRRYFRDDLQALLIDAHEEREREQEDLEERQDALADCMKKLRSRDQELLQACYGGSVRVAEVAQSWDRSIQSIHNSLSRIRRTLYECVQRTLKVRGFE